MTIPAADLTTAHLDAGTDDPKQARVELKAAIDKLNALLTDIGVGSSVWTTANDGASSGLDADLLDGQHGAYYNALGNATGTLAIANGGTNATSSAQARTNLGLGALAVLSSVGASQIDANAVGSSELGTDAVHQVNVATTKETGTVTENVAVLTAGGNYNFVPVVDADGVGAGTDSHISMHCAEDGSGDSCAIVFGSTATGGATGDYDIEYIQNSPPYRVGDVEFPLFGFLFVDKNGNMLASSFAEDPTWAYNGPTDVRPHRYDEFGKRWRTVYDLNEDEKKYLMSNPRKYLELKSKRKFHEVEVTPEYKNADIDLLPHPFKPKKKNLGSVILLAPNEKTMLDMIELRKDGAKLPYIFRKYMKLDNQALKIKGIHGSVQVCKAVWKNTSF